MPKRSPTDLLQRTYPRAPYNYPTTGGGSGLEQRRVTRIVTGPVDTETGLARGGATLPASAGQFLLSLQSTYDIWVRLYGTATDRDNDNARIVTDAVPTDKHMIVDALLQKTVTPPPLDRTLWSAGPGDSDPDDFNYLLVAPYSDDSQSAGASWQTPHNQEVGDALVVDFGFPITLGSFSLYSDLIQAPPAALSLEVSNDGSVWRMEQADIPATWHTTIYFSGPLTTQYIRVKIVTINASFSAAWNLSNIDATPYSDDNLYLRLTDNQEDGVPCFNMDDPAEPSVYYTVQRDPVAAYSLYFSTWGAPDCFIRGWVPVPTSDPGTYTAWEHSPNDCYLTGNLPPPSDFVYTGTVETPWPLLYMNGPYLKAGGNVLGLFGQVPKAMSLAVATVMGIYSNDTDALMGAATAAICYYMDVDDFANNAYLYAGFVASGTGGEYKIIYVDATMTEHVLAASSSVSLTDGHAIDFTCSIGTDEDANVICTLSGTGVVSISCAVPTDLLALQQTGVGIKMYAVSPVDAIKAFAGLPLSSVQIAGGDGTAQFDLGYTPIEIPGGTLRVPAGLNQ